MNEDMELGMIIAYQSVKEELSTIKAELGRKGIETKYFSVLEEFIEDNLNQLYKEGWYEL